MNDKNNGELVRIGDTCSHCICRNIHIAKVEGLADFLLEPDTLEVLFHVESTKEKAEDAKNSVSKRIDYILHIIKNSQIQWLNSDETLWLAMKELLKDARVGSNVENLFQAEINVSVFNVLSRINGEFSVVGEVLWECDASEKYENVISIIVEKLEGSVLITGPHFYHSTECIQEGREKALKMAISCARAKAVIIAQASNQYAGPALSVEEKDHLVSKVNPLPGEWKESVIKQRHVQAFIIHSRVEVMYELLSHKKLRENPV